MDVECLRQELGIIKSWEIHGAGLWVEDSHLDVESLARWMGKHHGRFVTLTARPFPGGECRLDYHWDLEGQLLSLTTITHEGSIPSIAALCPAADWVEREVHDYFAIDFMGRDETRPLMLRPDDRPGIFLDGEEAR